MIGSHPPVLCPARSPLINAVVVGERERWMDDVMNSFIIQAPVCLERDSRTTVQEERDGPGY